MWREIRFPVIGQPSLGTDEYMPTSVDPAIEFFVLEHDEASGCWRHPTNGREMSGELYAKLGTEWAHAWLRGLED